MTLISVIENLLNETKIYHIIQQLIYLISLSSTFFIIVDFLIVFLFSANTGTRINFV